MNAKNTIVNLIVPVGLTALTAFGDAGEEEKPLEPPVLLLELQADISTGLAAIRDKDITPEERRREFEEFEELNRNIRREAETLELDFLEEKRSLSSGGLIPGQPSAHEELMFGLRDLKRAESLSPAKRRELLEEFEVENRELFEGIESEDAIALARRVERSKLIQPPAENEGASNERDVAEALRNLRESTSDPELRRSLFEEFDQLNEDLLLELETNGEKTEMSR